MFAHADMLRSSILCMLCCRAMNKRKGKFRSNSNEPPSKLSKTESGAVEQSAGESPARCSLQTDVENAVLKQMNVVSGPLIEKEFTLIEPERGLPLAEQFFTRPAYRDSVLM